MPFLLGVSIFALGEGSLLVPFLNNRKGQIVRWSGTAVPSDSRSSYPHSRDTVCPRESCKRRGRPRVITMWAGEGWRRGGVSGNKDAGGIGICRSSMLGDEGGKQSCFVSILSP
jgi:hypothetical protein